MPHRLKVYFLRTITKPYWVIKRWALPIALLYTVALTFVSLINIGGVPELGSSMDDKIYHVFAYVVFVWVLHNYFRNTAFKNTILISVCTAIIYGIILEVLQQSFTVSRVSDPYDVMANVIGVAMGVVVIFLTRNLKFNY